MLVLPVLVPVLISAVRCWQAASVGAGLAIGEWLSILATFAVVYVAAGIVLYGQIQESQ